MLLIAIDCQGAAALSFPYYQTYLLSVYLSLHHGWSLCPQHFDSLENVHRPFVTHPLQDNTQSDEDACPSHASTVHTQRNIVADKAPTTTCSNPADHALTMLLAAYLQ